MRLSSLHFLFEEAGKNIRRNGLMSLAALTTVTFSMAVLGGALFALYRLHQFAAALPRQFEIVVFEHPNVPRERTMAVKRRIQALPGVARVALVTKERAYAQMQQEDREGETNIAGDLEGENPLPDAFNVILKDPRQTAQVCAMLRDGAQFPEVHKVRDDHETLRQVLAASRLVTNIGGAAAFLLFLATAFVIQNTIRLTVFARRREIRIMQLVGATPAFIRLPLMLEGVFYGVCGAALAAGIVLFIVYEVSLYVRRFETPLALSAPEAVGPAAVIGFLVALGAFVGWAGSALSIRRFLKRI